MLVKKQATMEFEFVQPQQQQEEEPTLESWLESLQLSEHIEAFRHHGFTFQLIRAHGLDEHDLTAMGILKRAHVKLLLAEAERLRKMDSSPLAAFTSFAITNAPIEASRACFYLDLAIELKEEKVIRVCLDFIQKNTAQAFASPNFLNTSAKALELILADPGLEIDEFSLFMAFMRWRASHPSENVAAMVKHFRFGTMPANILATVVEPTKLVPAELLLAAYRHHALPDLKVPPPTPHFFTPRQRGSADLTPIFPNSARGVQWALKMSSMYSGLPNDFASLTNDQACHPGCATNCSGNEWVQASFDWPVLVTKVRLSAPSQGLFASQGWGMSYLQNTEIQCSDDGNQWETVATVTSVKPDGFTECDIKPRISRFWRLFKKTGYVATGSFILE